MARNPAAARYRIGQLLRPLLRHRAFARRLLAHVVERHGHEPLALHAQVYAQPLYAGLGFATYGDEYLEAGIPHIGMYRAAQPAPMADPVR